MALCPLQPLSKQKSLLSQLLLQEQRAQASEADGNGQYEMDSECDVEDDEDVGCSEGGEEDAEGFEECADEEMVSPNSPSKPIAIRRPEG